MRGAAADLDQVLLQTCRNVRAAEVCTNYTYWQLLIIVVIMIRVGKAYGTRCSQAVPHPSTILARRCLTSVIRRERVCSSWYGRRQLAPDFNWCHFFKPVSDFFYNRLGTPQALLILQVAPLRSKTSKVQIKNIKLHIVTDIKVTFNSMLGFRISIWLGGRALLLNNETFVTSFVRSHNN